MGEELIRMFDEAPDCWYCGIKALWLDVTFFEDCQAGPWILCHTCGIWMPLCPCGQGCERSPSKRKASHA